MTWTPLITADAFTGIQTDLITTAGGVVSILLIVVGLGFLLRALFK